jgi:hypothetical protein
MCRQKKVGQLISDIVKPLSKEIHLKILSFSVGLKLSNLKLGRREAASH